MDDDAKKKAVEELKNLAEGMAGKKLILQGMTEVCRHWVHYCEKHGIDAPLLVVAADPTLNTAMGSIVASKSVGCTRENMVRMAELFLGIESEPGSTTHEL